MKLKKWHWIAGISALLLIAVATVAFIKRDGIKYRVTVWRANSLLEDAKEAAEQENWKESERLALAGWQLYQGNIEILRHLFDSSKQLRSRYLLATARMIFEHPGSSPEDRFEALRIYLSIGDFVTFKSLFSRLSKEEQVHPDAMELGTHFLMARNDLPRSLILINELMKTRGNDKDRLLKARILSKMSSREESAAAEAQRLIDEIFQPGHEYALPAFSLVKEIPKEKRQLERFSDATDRLNQIEADSNPVPAQLWLLALDLELSRSPGERKAIIDQAVSDWKKQDLTALCSWLLSLNEPDRVLRNLPSEKAEESEELFKILVQAHILNQNWDEATELLAAAHPNIRQSLVLGLRAAIKMQQGETAASQTLWSRAFRQAELSTGQSALLELAKLAGRSGNEDIRNRAVTEALKRPSAVNLPASEVAFLFSKLASEDEAEDLLTISRNLLASDPENPMLVNNVAWLELLSGRGREEIATRLQELVERFPDNASLRSTLALAFLEIGQPDQAVIVLAPIINNVNRGVASASTDQAVVALAFARHGDRIRARTLFEGIDWTQMMTIEEQFFKSNISAELSQ